MSVRVRPLVVLFVMVLFVAVGAVAVTATTVDGHHPGDAHSDVAVDETADTSDNLAEDLNETTDDSMESLNETADGTGDTLNETADDPQESPNETSGDAEESLNETTDEVGDTLDGTTSNLEQNLDETTDELGDSLDGMAGGSEEALNETTDELADSPDETTSSPEDSPDETVDGPTDIGENTPGDGYDLGGDSAIVDTWDAIGGDRGGVASEPSGAGSSSDAPDATEQSSDTATAETEPKANADDENALPGGATGSGIAAGALVAGVTLLGRSASVTAWLSATGGSGGSLLTTVLSLLQAWTDRILAFIGYKRYSDDDPLEHAGRRQLYEAIRSSPGTYLAELSEETDIERETARYHLRILEFENLVSHESIRGRRRYFPVDTEWKGLQAALNDDPTAALIDTLERHGPATVSGLADRLDRDPSTVSHHLDRLAEDGIVERERNGRAVVNRLTAGAANALERSPSQAGARAPNPSD